MKSVLYVFGILLIVVYTQCKPQGGGMKEMIQECKEEVGIADNERVGQEDTKMYCLKACMWKRLGAMNQDNKLDREKTVAMMKKMSKGQMDEDKLNDCVNRANTKPDGCEVMRELQACLKE